MQKGAPPACVLQRFRCYRYVSKTVLVQKKAEGDNSLVQKGGLRRNKTYAEEGSPGMCFTVFLLVYLCVKGSAGAEEG